jgi:hypothetical protein
VSAAEPDIPPAPPLAPLVEPLVAPPATEEHTVPGIEAMPTDEELRDEGAP